MMKGLYILDMIYDYLWISLLARSLLIHCSECKIDFKIQDAIICEIARFLRYFKTRDFVIFHLETDMLVNFGKKTGWGSTVEPIFHNHSRKKP